MACPVTYNSIKSSLTKDITKRLETQSPQEINTLFGEQVINSNKEVTIPDSLINVYYDTYIQKAYPGLMLQIVGERAASNIDAQEELEIAKQMEKEGISPQRIRLATGWEKNKTDDKWRYEILDGKITDLDIQYNQAEEGFEGKVGKYKLSEYYENEELYRSYPELVDTEVVFYEEMSEDDGRDGYVKRGRLFLNMGRDLPREVRNSTILHEIQHLIQKIEGFEGGSEQGPFFRVLVSIYNKIRSGNALTPSEKELNRQIGLIKKNPNYVQDTLYLRERNRKFLSTLSFDLYLQTAGEVEARNVQTRENLTREERYKQMLSSTESFSSDQQIVLSRVKSFLTRQGLQPREVNIPEASSNLRDFLTTFAEQSGFNIEEVKEVTLNGQTLKANGIALPFQQLIQYVQGNTNALTEESMHIAVELISQKNPALFNQMMSSITSLPLYKDVLASYRNNPFYQKDGKVDFQKIKKEAIGKQLTNTIIAQDGTAQVNNWWDKIVNFLKSIFGSTAKQMQVFQDAVNVILQEDLGTIRDTLLQSETYLKEQGLTDEQVQSVIELANSNITNDELNLAIGNIVPQMVFQQTQTNAEFDRVINLQDRITEKDGKFYIDGKEIKNNTKNKAKGVLNSSPEQKAVLGQIQNREESPVYKATQDILRRYIGSDGSLRFSPLRQENFDLSDAAYNSLDDNISERLQSFPEGTSFAYNINLYAQDTIGNVDLLAVTEGKVNIINFQEISVPEGSNIPGYETKALRAVLDANRNLLKSMGYNSLGQTRIIPINRITQENNTELIEIGSVQIDNEDNDYLTPLPATAESTGNAELDTFIKKLNNLANKIASTSVSSAQQSLKNKQVAQLYRGIRQLQVNRNIYPLLNQSRNVSKKIDELLVRYNKSIKGGKLSKNEIRSFTDELMLMSQIADTYSDLDNVYDEIDNGYIGLRSQVRKAASDVKVAKNKIDKILRNFVDEHITSKLGISDILRPERVVKFMQRNFRSLSQTSTAATQALYKLLYPIRQRVDIEQNEEIKRLADIKTRYEAWAKSKGLALKDMISPITKKDSKNRYIHELIDRYSPTFYEDLRKAQENNDIEWVKNNLDTDSYNRWFEATKTENFFDIEQTTYSYDNEENEKIKEQEREKFLNKYDISKNISTFNAELKNHPKQSWETEEYKNLEAPALELYNYIQEKSSKAVDLGVMNAWQSRSFIPQIRKDLLEKVVFGGITSSRIGESLYQSITINKEDLEYGSIDPLTGEIKDEIPFYFLQDLSQTVIDETGVEYQDYSGVSTNIFSVMEAFNKQLLKYEYLTEIESQVNAVGQIERNKKALATNRFGNAIEDGELVENTENYQYFQNFVKATFYGQKNVGSEWDVKVGTLANNTGKKLNKILGKEVFSTDYSGTMVSLSKAVDTANRFFSLKVLGLNIPVSISNFFGTNFNAWIESGKYFTRNDFREMEYGILMGKLSSAKDKIQVAAMDYFIPFVEGENSQSEARQLSMSALNKYSIPELLMSVQRVSDRPVQWGIAGATLKNTMIVNGKFVNIRQNLRNSPEYSNIYDLPQEQRQKVQASFEAKVKELQDTQSILAIAEIKDDMFTIPGIERNSEAVYEFREFVQQLTRNATGMGNQDDIRQINLSLIGRSTMMFKNWVPRLVDRRFSDLRYIPATNDYEWGRVKVLMNLLGKGVLKSAKNLNNVLKLNDAGVELLQQEYKAQKIKYESQTGKEFKMTQRDFIEMYSRSIKAEMMELGTMLTLIGIIFAAKAFAPDDDKEDPKVKGFYKWSLRIIDKVIGELSFFYNPLEWVKMSNGSMFPALSVVKDAYSVTSNVLEQGFGFVTNDEELMDSAKPAKYIMKSFPILKSLTPYMAILLSEAEQEEFGISARTEFSDRN